MKPNTMRQAKADAFHALNYLRVVGEPIPAKGGTIYDPSTLGGLFDMSHVNTQGTGDTQAQAPSVKQVALFGEGRE